MENLLLALALMCLDSSYMTGATGSPQAQRYCVAEILECIGDDIQVKTRLVKTSKCIKPKPICRGKKCRKKQEE